MTTSPRPPLPDWCQVGSKAIALAYLTGADHPSLGRVTIERITPTTVTASGARYQRPRTPGGDISRQVGGAYGTRYRLLPETHPEVVRALEHVMRRRVTMALENAARTWRNHDTAEARKAIEDAMARAASHLTRYPLPSEESTT